MTKKILCDLFGFTEKTLYNWRDRKVINFIKKYIREDDIKQYLEENRCDDLEIYKEWLTQQPNLEKKLIAKIHNLCLTENNEIEEYKFIDYIMKLFLEFETIKRDEYSSLVDDDLVKSTMTFNDIYNLYLMDNPKVLAKEDINNEFRKHQILSKLKGLSSIDDTESLILLKSIFKIFTNLIIQPLNGSVNESRGLAILALIYKVYNIDKAKDMSIEEKIDLAIGKSLNHMLKTNSYNKIFKIYLEQESVIEDYIQKI